MKKGLMRYGAIFAMILVLILDSATALKGAAEGIDLCIRSLIPAIFPFLVLTSLLLSVFLRGNLTFLYPFGRLLGIPRGAEGIFLTGLLGGYPTGAHMVTLAWEKGQLKRPDAQRMLGFCSNAGPSFLFGILAAEFPSPWQLWTLWGIHILSAILVALLLPGRSSDCGNAVPRPDISVTEAVKNAVRTMSYICGWVVLFRTLLAFLDRWFLWLLPEALRVLVYGIFELANGCCAAGSVTSEALRFIICSAMLAFGGLCVLMQTAAVTGRLGLGMYLPGKLLQMLVSVVLSVIVYTPMLKPDMAVVTILSSFALLIAVIILLRKTKIRGRNPMEIGV